jgi:hypothetical protein
MAFLNSTDPLTFDPLKGTDPLRIDPLGKGQSNRMRTYDKELGFAVFPEEKAAIEKLRQQNNARVNQLQSERASNAQTFQGALASGNAKAAGVLAQFKTANYGGTVPVIVQSPGTGAPQVYNVDKGWAKSNLSKVGASQQDNGSYLVQNQRGLEHALSMVQDSSQQAADIVSQSNAITRKNKAAVEAQIKSQRNIATQKFNQIDSEYATAIQAQQDSWNQYLGDLKSNFQRGIETNNGGIRDLLQSGALIA